MIKSGLTMEKLMSCKLLLDAQDIPIDVHKVTRQMAINMGLRNFVYSEKQLAALKRQTLEQCCRALYRHHRGLSKFLRREYLK